MERGSLHPSPTDHIETADEQSHCGALREAQSEPIAVGSSLNVLGEAIMADVAALPAYVAVRGTMILATIAWAIGEVLMRRSPSLDRLARAIWTVGIALALTHVVLAFEFVYTWDHEAAVAATARQASELVGWGWRGGIFVNYVFLALWLGDVCWWWAARTSHSSRSMGFETARLAWFTFMFVNGAIVFASGAGRLVGIASVTVVLATALARRRVPMLQRTN